MQLGGLQLEQAEDDLHAVREGLRLEEDDRLLLERVLAQREHDRLARLVGVVVVLLADADEFLKIETIT